MLLKASEIVSQSIKLTGFTIWHFLKENSIINPHLLSQKKSELSLSKLLRVSFILSQDEHPLKLSVQFTPISSSTASYSDNGRMEDHTLQQPQAFLGLTFSGCCLAFARRGGIVYHSRNCSNRDFEEVA